MDEGKKNRQNLNVQLFVRGACHLTLGKDRNFPRPVHLCRECKIPKAGPAPASRFLNAWSSLETTFSFVVCFRDFTSTSEQQTLNLEAHSKRSAYKLQASYNTPS